VKDDYQHRGIGTELLSYLTYLAKREGLLGFTAEVLAENRPMLNLFEKWALILTREVLKEYMN
jgi:GNAT superfamily N-acetyltransferase